MPRGLWMLCCLALMAPPTLALAASPPDPAGACQNTSKRGTVKRGTVKRGATKKGAATRTPTKKKAPAKRPAPPKRRPAPAARSKAPLEVPVDIGIGPAVHFITGPIQDDGLHSGLKVSVQAILDAALIKQNLHRVPKKYRGMAKGLNEVRVSPSIFIPDTLFLSPKIDHTQMWGVNFRPVSIGLPLLRVPRLHIGVGLDLTYAYIDSDLPTLGTTHFLRPGLDATADLEIPLSTSFLVSVGWTSMFYPPQEVGGPIFALGELDQSIWHIGQAYLKLHFRFPYRL